MKHTLWLAFVAAWLALPWSASAQLIALSTSGDANLAAEAPTSTAGAVTIRRGLICNATACNIIDLTPSGGGSPGLPDRAVFAIEKDTGCASTVDFTPQGSNRSGAWDDCTGAGTPYTCCTGVNTGCTFDLSAAIQDVGNQVVVTPIVNRYITGLLADTGSCTDVEVMVTLYYENDNVR